MNSSSILFYTFYVAMVAWLYSIGVLFLSDSVPERYNLFMAKCMWLTLMSGISLMCSRTPSWRTLHIVSHRERLFAQNSERTPPTLDSFWPCFCVSLNKRSYLFFNTASQGRSGFKKPKKLCLIHPVIRPSLSERRVFCSNRKKPLWSRLSPAANDVNPVYTVFVNLSLLVKKWCLNLSQMCWFTGVRTYANIEVLCGDLVEAVLALNKKARRGSLFEKKEGKNRKTLFTAGLGWKRGHLWSSMKHFFFIILYYMCVSQRDEGFQNCALRRTQQRYLGLFLFTSNIPNEFNVKGQMGVSYFPILFVIRWLKVVDGRILLCWMQKTDFAIQYKLLLLGKDRLFIFLMGLTSHGCNVESLFPYDD